MKMTKLLPLKVYPFTLYCLFADSRQAKLAMQKAERQEKILTLEDALETIRRAIHVSDGEVST